MTNDVPIGADGLDLGVLHSRDEEALVLIHLTPLPFENMTTRPDPVGDWQNKPRFLVEFAPGGGLEGFAGLCSSARRDPPPMST